MQLILVCVGLPYIKSWDSTVRVVAGLRARWYKVQLLAVERDVSLLQTVQPGSKTHRASYSGVQGSFSGINQPGCESDHSPPSSTKVKSEWSYTSSPLLCLHDICRDKFAFTGPRSNRLCVMFKSTTRQTCSPHQKSGVWQHVQLKQFTLLIWTIFF